MLRSASWGWFLLLSIHKTHLIKEILKDWSAKGGWPLSHFCTLFLFGFLELLIHPLPHLIAFPVIRSLLLHPPLIYSVHNPSALCRLLHRPPSISWVTPEAVSFCCVLIIVSINLAYCGGPMRPKLSVAVGPGQFEGWFRVVKGRNSTCTLFLQSAAARQWNLRRISGHTLVWIGMIICKSRF